MSCGFLYLRAFFIFMGKRLKLIGQVFNKLTVVSEHFDNLKSKVTKWLCKCQCGNYIIVQGNNLTNGHTKSCGCYMIEKTKEANTKHGCCGRENTTPEYEAWSSMKSRCNNPNSTKAKNYGLNGITICDRWMNSFENFISDMGERTSPKHSLDRYPNNKGNYEPSNCRWATQKQQQGNRTNNRWIEYNGRNMILQEWADFLKVSSDALSLLLKSRSFEYCYNYYIKRYGGRKPIEKIF
jgi:hypothetical protein